MDLKGLTPLYYTVLHGGDSYCCQLLLDEHAEIGVTDHQGMQEIHHVGHWCIIEVSYYSVYVVHK